MPELEALIATKVGTKVGNLTPLLPRLKDGPMLLVRYGFTVMGWPRVSIYAACSFHISHIVRLSVNDNFRAIPGAPRITAPHSVFRCKNKECLRDCPSGLRRWSTNGVRELVAPHREL